MCRGVRTCAHTCTIFAHMLLCLGTRGNAHIKEGDLSRVMAFVGGGAVDVTVHTGERAQQCILASKHHTAARPPHAPPFLPGAERRFPPKGDRDSRWQPALGLKPPAACPCSGEEWWLPGSLQVLTGWPRLRLPAWGPVRRESGSPGEKLIHCLYQSWGGEQQGEGEIPRGKCGEAWLTCSRVPRSPPLGSPGGLLRAWVCDHVCGCLSGRRICACVSL